MKKKNEVTQFKGLPPVEGPLTRFEAERTTILKSVESFSLSSLEDPAETRIDAPIEAMISEACHQEHLRMQRLKRTSPSYMWNLPRHIRDQVLWKSVRRSLKKRETEGRERELLAKIVHHYVREIGGHFDPKVYDFTTRMTPFLFNWLLNAAAARQFSPWKTQSLLESRLRIQGNLDHFQRLSKLGTVILVPTHQSNIDSLLIGYVIYLLMLPPFAYGAGLNLFTNPVLGFFMSNLGAYTVDRLKSNELYKHVLKAYSTEIIRRGVHSVFYPGGGRSRNGAIETKLKLGLLGTGLRAQIERLKSGEPNAGVYIVPMVTSYEFVFEALSLIEDYLARLGEHRFLGADTEEALPVAKMVKWAWKFFSLESKITVRIGKPMDVFGNLVDESGRSIGPNGTTIDPKRWLTTNGELRPDEARDSQYTRLLGEKIVDSYYRNNTVLSAHLLAFSFFSALRKRYPDLDLFRLLRLTLAQRSIPYDDFVKTAAEMHELVQERAVRGELVLCEELTRMNVETWIKDGLRGLGVLHDHGVVRVENGVVWTEDMNLLYYYRNRLTGYGMVPATERGRLRILRGEPDEKGFLV